MASNLNGPRKLLFVVYDLEIFFFLIYIHVLLKNVFFLQRNTQLLCKWNSHGELGAWDANLNTRTHDNMLFWCQTKYRIALII